MRCVVSIPVPSDVPFLLKKARAYSQSELEDGYYEITINKVKQNHQLAEKGKSHRAADFSTAG